MAYITADIDKFVGAYSVLNHSNRRIPTTLLQLAHAAITVGQQGISQTRQLGRFRRKQLLYTILANVEINNNRLCIHQSYYNLDQKLHMEL